MKGYLRMKAYILVLAAASLSMAGCATGPERLHPGEAPAGDEGMRANRISTEVFYLGVGLRYERDISDSLSLGGTVFHGFGLGMGFGDLYTGILGTARFYPSGAPFYIELGAGLGFLLEPSIPNGFGDARAGFMAAPATGFRLGGRKTALFVSPYLSLPWIIGAPPVFLVGVGFGGAW